jgi:hypothetical protein
MAAAALEQLQSVGNTSWPGGSTLQRFDVCSNVSYTHRVDDPEAYNFCVVPDTGFDAVLFVALALLLTCLVKGQFSMLIVLVSGALASFVAPWP